MQSIESSQIPRSRQWNGGCQGLRGRRNGELLISEYKVTVMQDDKVLEICYAVLCLQLAALCT